MKHLFTFLLISISISSFTQNSFIKIDNLAIKDLNNFEAYSEIDSLLKDKKYIFLGESAHSAEEYIIAKHKMIKYLHEKHGFNKVVFESGLSDCYYGNKHKYENDSLWLMTHSIYGIWFSKSTLLMLNDFKKDNISIGGFDFQNSSRDQASSKFILELKNIDTSLLSETFKWDKFLMNFRLPEKADSNKLRILNDSLAICRNILNKNYNYIDSIYKNKQMKNMDDQYVSRIILNKLFFLSVCDDRKKWSALRDSVMSSNMQWFCDSLYPNDKIIFWGANDHIAREKSTFGNYYAGSVLPERIKSQSYYIGLYALSGEIFTWSSGRFTMGKLKKSSLEVRTHDYFNSDNDVFLDFTEASQRKDFRWLNKKTISYVLGNIPVKIVPAKNYDGVILINKLSVIY